MDRSPGLKLSATELAAMFGSEHWSGAFPPVLDVVTAARLAGVPVATIYDWSSRNLLRGCGLPPLYDPVLMRESSSGDPLACRSGAGS